MKNRLLVTCFLLLSSLALWSQTAHEDIQHLELKLANLSFDDSSAHFLDIINSRFSGFGSNLAITNIDMEDTGVMLTEGYRFSKYTVLEGSLTWMGDSTVTATTDSGTYVLSMQQYAIDMQLAGTYPIRDWLKAYVKAGGMLWRNESDLNGPNVDQGVNKNGVDLIITGGVRARFFERLTASLEYMSTEVDGLDLTSLNLGVGFTF